jgi:hypothetical protein
MDSARGLACLVVLACLLGAPATALADTTSSVDRGGARAPGLKRAERNALDIRSIRATGGPWGVIVEARFRGNVGAIGRRGLRHALVAMALHPRGSGQNAVVLATQGPLPRTDTLRSTRSEDVAVVRDGRQIDFLVFGGGLENVGRIEVKAFARRPGRGARAAAERELSDAEARRLVNARAADRGSVDAPAAMDDNDAICAALLEEARDYEDQRQRRQREREQAGAEFDYGGAEGLDEILRQIRDAQAGVRRALGRYRCFTITAANFGYEHHQGFSEICGDFDYDRLEAHADAVEYVRLFRRNAAGDYEQLQGAQPLMAQPSERRRYVRFRIDQAGSYKVVFKDTDLEQPVEVEIDVPPPPEPRLTRDCT